VVGVSPRQRVVYVQRTARRCSPTKPQEEPDQSSVRLNQAWATSRIVAGMENTPCAASRKEEMKRWRACRRCGGGINRNANGRRQTLRGRVRCWRCINPAGVNGSGATRKIAKNGGGQPRTKAYVVFGTLRNRGNRWFLFKRQAACAAQ